MKPPARFALLAGVAWVSLSAFLPFRALAEAADPAAADPSSDPSDRLWPMRLKSGADRYAVYAPVWESWTEDFLSGRAAASLTTLDASEPVFGAVRLECRVAVDRVARTVRILEARVSAARFPGIEGAPDRALSEAISREIEERPVVFSLDRLQERLEAAKREAVAAADLRHVPPRIVFRDHPAVKVQYDGTPLLGEVDGAPLMRAVNTPFLVVLDPTTKTYYLRGAGRWFSAPDALGPFQDAGDVPGGVSAIAATEDVSDSRSDVSAVQAADVEIVTATEPTELIWTDGPPRLAPVAGTDLLSYANTESDVFLRIPTQDYYVLVSGRWYTAPGKDGPWTHVPPDRLPGDFARIPPGSDKGHVLAHVAGTLPAREALLDNDVPQAAAVDRESARRPDVAYDGEPRFEPVERLSVRCAVNTAYSVMEVGGLYYCCYDAVWFTGRSPFGPWDVCTAVPGVIYMLPPSCPLYPVRYVYVYEVTPTVVYCGYLPGYLGCYPYGGVVVYGTGYRYPSWFRTHYYPRPCTFGYAARYHVHHGGWSFSVGWGGPCWLSLRIGFGGWVSRGAYGVHCGGGWWGYGGYRHLDVRTPVPIRTGVVVNVQPGAGGFRGSDRPPRDSVYARSGDPHREPIGAPREDRRGDRGEGRTGWEGPVARDRERDSTPGLGPDRRPGSQGFDPSRRPSGVSRDGGEAPGGWNRQEQNPRPGEGWIRADRNPPESLDRGGRSPVGVMDRGDRAQTGSWDRTDRNPWGDRVVTPPSRGTPPTIDRPRGGSEGSSRSSGLPVERPPSYQRGPDRGFGSSYGSSRDSGGARGWGIGGSSVPPPSPAPPPSVSEGRSSSSEPRVRSGSSSGSSRSGGARRK